MALIDPKHLKEYDFLEQFILQRPIDAFPLEVDGFNPDWINPSRAQAYSIDDLNRALRDLQEAHLCLVLFGSFLFSEPRSDVAEKFGISIQDQQAEQDRVLALLCEQPSLREALRRIREGPKKPQEQTDESPP